MSESKRLRAEQELRITILHDLKKVARTISELDKIKNQLDGAVGALIGDLDRVIKKEPSSE